MGYWGWRPYVSKAQRMRRAAAEMAKLKKKGHPVSPVIVEGRAIAAMVGAPWLNEARCSGVRIATCSCWRCTGVGAM